MALACVTGASSGIGKEFARQLSEKGYDLILVARNKRRLDAIAKKCAASCEVFVCDLSDEEECARLAQMLEARPVDLLVNNAGFGNLGVFDENDLETDVRMIEVNVCATHYLTHRVLKQMKQRGRGEIVNVASVAGLMPGGPMMATYYATKAYVASLTSAIAEELRAENSRVRVYALCPGPVNTRFNETAGVTFSLPGISARQCVRACLNGMRRGKTVIVPGVLPAAGSVAARLAPRKFVLRVLMRGQQRKTGA